MSYQPKNSYVGGMSSFLAAVGESRRRMQGYSPAERAKLEAAAHVIIKKGAEKSRLTLPNKRPSS
jgi:hypothetical protein